jgi:hypothetical protein
MQPSRASACFVLIAFLSVGCRASPTDAGSPGDGTALVGRFGNLVQTVTIEPPVPVYGENIVIRSAIVNRGARGVALSSRHCGLDYAGSLELAWPPGIAKCAAYSGRGELAPGDSVVGYDLMTVASPPGRHLLRVRHALEPEAWAELSVNVRAP